MKTIMTITKQHNFIPALATELSLVRSNYQYNWDILGLFRSECEPLDTHKLMSDGKFNRFKRHFTRNRHPGKR